MERRKEKLLGNSLSSLELFNNLDDTCAKFNRENLQNRSFNPFEIVTFKCVGILH